MKNRMKTRKSLNKISTFLKTKKTKKSKHSENRFVARNPKNMPNSSKIGAGSVTARRNLPEGTIHRRNHRTNVMIGIAS